MSDSLWPHELQHARPPCPSPTPGVHPNMSIIQIPMASKISIEAFFIWRSNKGEKTVRMWFKDNICRNQKMWPPVAEWEWEEFSRRGPTPSSATSASCVTSEIHLLSLVFSFLSYKVKHWIRLPQQGPSVLRIYTQHLKHSNIMGTTCCSSYRMFTFYGLYKSDLSLTITAPYKQLTRGKAQSFNCWQYFNTI